MSASNSKPVPLFPPYQDLVDLTQGDYPELDTFLDTGQTWRKEHWLWARDFLVYLGRNKSEHTYLRFRTEVERFLLWVFLYKDKPAADLRKKDILEFIDFLWKPPAAWIGIKNVDRFELIAGSFRVKSDWHPFRYKTPKNTQTDDVDKRRYKPSQETLKAAFSGLSAFYSYLVQEEISIGNPILLARKDCRYFIKGAQVKEVRRLTEDQWGFVLTVATDMANKDPAYERNLFLIASLKALFLRISELSERKEWSPVMKHFWQDESGNWWLRVFGKGRKLRDVSVPDQYLDYLKRYRAYRGENGLPSSTDDAPLIEKLRGQGGMTSRHLTRLVQQVFDAAHDAMKKDRTPEEADSLRIASTHWLRHTGASMEVERGRSLKDVSEDLGHASMATTDTIYVQSEAKKRAASGKKRQV